MGVDLWSVDRARELTTFYNEQVRCVPCCYPVETERFASGMLWSWHPELRDPQTERLVVAQEAEGIIGFAHIGILKPRQADQSPQGLMRFFCYAPGRRPAGQQVLALAEKTLRGMGVRRIVAFDIHQGYQFYHFRRGFLVDKLTHVFGLMLANGYEIDESQVFMELDQLQPRDCALPDRAVGAGLEVSATPWDQGGLSMRLLRGQEELARCNGRPASEDSDMTEARDLYMIGGLHVCESLRDQGLGRYLLEAMHSELYARGYRRMAICTEADNWRAMLLYANRGYRIVCQEYAFQKDVQVTANTTA